MGYLIAFATLIIMNARFKTKPTLKSQNYVKAIKKSPKLVLFDITMVLISSSITVLMTLVYDVEQIDYPFAVGVIEKNMDTVVSK